MPELQPYTRRFYRNWTAPEGMYPFTIQVKDSDLSIFTDNPSNDLKDKTQVFLSQIRMELEKYIGIDPIFRTSLIAHSPRKNKAPPMAMNMCSVCNPFNIGPMASVAGAFADAVANFLLGACDCNSVIVENGGDIFMKLDRPARIALYAGEDSPFKDKIHFEVDAQNGIGVCTSSKKVGPSLSLGNADAVVIIAKNATLADAAATFVANQIKTPDDVTRVVEAESKRNQLIGLIACCEDKIAMWGDLKLV